jgi:vacuolar-type H+-ATPase subunit I/STV1
VIDSLLNSNSWKLFDIFQELNTRNLELKTLNEAFSNLQSLEKEVSVLKEEKINILESENSLKLQLLESRKECEDIKSEMISQKEQNNGSDVISFLEGQLVERRKECEDAKRSSEIAIQEKSELQIEYSNMKNEMQVNLETSSTLLNKELANVQGTMYIYVYIYIYIYIYKYTYICTLYTSIYKCNLINII